MPRWPRIRLRLGLHTGKGQDTIFELWWRWGRYAAFRHSRRTRPTLTFGGKLLAGAAAYSIRIGRGHYQHSLRLPLDKHAAIFSPPREGKTASTLAALTSLGQAVTAALQRSS